MVSKKVNTKNNNMGTWALMATAKVHHKLPLIKTSRCHTKVPLTHVCILHETKKLFKYS